ncbi:MAG: VOC family protein [Gammaproteobacteria bacterium]|jgi:catechol 2,3-dioxygenase-like lactoylglutathione lyase family enzyme|nr:VOC family protein [Gammaproteobacteria bacterium]MDH3806097.1 VOC family protein [Gammaproteobacteria bacterium]
MKRFHVNLAVANLAQSIDFYRTLFGEDPTVLKDDYAKWMLDDPRVNFSISQSSRLTGVSHIGLQADTMSELGEIQERLHNAGQATLEQPDAECCYARSSKTWVRDPDDVAWETFVTHNDITHYGSDRAPQQGEAAKEISRCCA